MNRNLHMFRDEFVVKKGLLTSTGVFFFPEKTPEANELMTIAFGEVNTILFITVSAFHG